MTHRIDRYHGVSPRSMYCLVFFLLSLILLSIWGCGGPVIKFGRMPDTTRLEESLKPETSTRDDVLEAVPCFRSMTVREICGSITTKREP